MGVQCEGLSAATGSELLAAGSRARGVQPIGGVWAACTLGTSGSCQIILDR